MREENKDFVQIAFASYEDSYESYGAQVISSLKIGKKLLII